MTPSLTSEYQKVVKNLHLYNSMRNEVMHRENIVFSLKNLDVQQTLVTDIQHGRDYLTRILPSIGFVLD